MTVEITTADGTTIKLDISAASEIRSCERLQTTMTRAMAEAIGRGVTGRSFTPGVGFEVSY